MPIFPISQIDGFEKLFKETNEDFNVASFEFLTFAVIAPPGDG